MTAPAISGRRPFWLADVLAGLAHLFLVLAAYWPNVASRGDYLDTYNVVEDANAGIWDKSGPLIVSMGRPLDLLVLKLTLPFVHTLSDLRLFRITTVIGLGLLAYAFYRLLVTAGVARKFAFVIPLLLVTLPPFQVWASWGILFPGPYAGILAVSSALTAWRMREHRPFSGRWLLLGALALTQLVAAAALYQVPWALFAVAAAVLLLLGGSPTSTWRELVRDYAIFIGLSLGSLVVDALLAKVLTRLIYGSAPDMVASRIELVTDVPAKVSWFLKGPLTDSARLWQIGGTGVLLPSLVGVVALGSLLIPLQRRVPAAALRAVLVLTLLPLSYLPNLVVAESWASYRTRAALAAYIACGACLAIVALFGQIGPRPAGRRATRGGRARTWVGWLPATALAVAAVVGLVAANRTVTTYFTEPQAKELAFIQEQLAMHHADQASSIDVIGCTWQNSLAPKSYFDEFGNPSCGEPWATVAEVRMVLEQMHPGISRIPMKLIDPSASPSPSPSPGGIVIDMRRLCCR